MQQEVIVAHRAGARGREWLLPFDDGLETGDGGLGSAGRGAVRRGRGPGHFAQGRLFGRELEVDLVIELHGDRHAVLRSRLEAQLAGRLQRRLVEPVPRSSGNLRRTHFPVPVHDDLDEHRARCAVAARLFRKARLDALEEARWRNAFGQPRVERRLRRRLRARKRWHGDQERSGGQRERNAKQDRTRAHGRRLESRTGAVAKRVERFVGSLIRHAAS